MKRKRKRRRKQGSNLKLNYSFCAISICEKLVTGSKLFISIYIISLEEFKL